MLTFFINKRLNNQGQGGEAMDTFGDFGIIHERTIKELAESILEIFLNLPENKKKERVGFYLFVTTPSFVVIAESFGGLKEADIETFFSEAMEKTNRMRKKHKPKGHISGRESARPAEDLFGGAIAAGDYIFAAAGLGQLGDEAICLAIAFELRLIGKPEIKKIIKLSKNELFISLMNAIEKKKKRDVKQ